MNNAWDIVTKWALAIAGGIAGFFMGVWTPLLTILTWCMALDILTGLIVAFTGNSPKTAGGGVSSAAIWEGVGKKIIIMAIVGLAALIDSATGNAVFMAAAATYYVANEGISILENAVLMGVPVPDALKMALEVMRDRKDSKETPTEYDPPDD